ncbi:hypothetical protein LCGC14_2892430, partial [marine sediment metagenome]
LNPVALSHSSELQDGSTFAQTTRVMVPVVLDSNVEVNGFHDDTLDPLIFEGVAAAFPPAKILSLSPDGGAAGDVSYSMEVDVANYSPGGNYGEIFGFSSTFQGHGPLIRGTLLENSAKTTSGVGTERVIGTLSALEGLWASLHVFGITGTTVTIDVKITSDVTGFASPTDRITFTQVTDSTGIGAEFIKLNGPITPDDEFRAEWTITGSSPSFSIFVTVGKRLLLR